MLFRSLCEHLYIHYLFTLDTAYLRDVYPVMRESALFFVDMLVEDPRSHYLVTAPTTSPENAYVMPNGKKVSVCAGSTMDNQILRELFSNTIQAMNNFIQGYSRSSSCEKNIKRCRRRRIIPKKPASTEGCFAGFCLKAEAIPRGI